MGSKKNKKNKGEDKNIITDPRFVSVNWDPRFKNVPKHKAKVEIDDRFKVMFTDPRFSSSSAPSDKRGKPKKADRGEALRQYYQTSRDEEEVKYDKVKPKEEGEESEEEDELSEESESEEEDRAKLKEEESESEELDGDVAGSESETTTDTDTDTDEDEEVVYEDGMPAMQVLLNY